jgi:hypothetical protein
MRKYQLGGPGRMTSVQEIALQTFRWLNRGPGRGLRYEACHVLSASNFDSVYTHPSESCVSLSFICLSYDMPNHVSSPTQGQLPTSWPAAVLYFP